MVILVTPMTHGPHVWWPAQMWCCDGYYLDFFRRRAQHQPLPRNSYIFEWVSTQ